MAAAGVCASTLPGSRGGVCARAWALGDVPQAPAFSSRLLEGLPQAPEDIRVVLGCREVAGLDSLGSERIGQPGFPCGLWEFPGDPLQGPVDQVLEAGLCPALPLQIAELRVGPALPPLSLGGAVALGRGMGGCGGVVGTGGGGRPGGVLVVFCREGARGARAWVDVEPQVRAHGLRLGVGLGFALAVVAGHLLDVG